MAALPGGHVELQEKQGAKLSKSRSLLHQSASAPPLSRLRRRRLCRSTSRCCRQAPPLHRALEAVGCVDGGACGHAHLRGGGGTVVWGSSGMLWAEQAGQRALKLRLPAAGETGCVLPCPLHSSLTHCACSCSCRSIGLPQAHAQTVLQPCRRWPSHCPPAPPLIPQHHNALVNQVKPAAHAPTAGPAGGSGSGAAP